MTCCCGVVSHSTPQSNVLNSASITELVSRAGGNVNALFRASLAWDSWSDIDFHLTEPDNTHIYFSKKTSGTTGGTLDVDMNIGSSPKAINTSSHSKPAVENIMYTDLNRMPDGLYKLSYVQYGIDGSRSDGGDTPYLLFEHRTSDEERMSHYVLLKHNGSNAGGGRPTVVLATVRKTGTHFSLEKLEPNVEILENHNFDLGQYSVTSSRTNTATGSAAETGTNPTGG